MVSPAAEDGKSMHNCREGEVVDITSVKIASVGVEGLGYAISINDATAVIEDLITGN